MSNTVEKRIEAAVEAMYNHEKNNLIMGKYWPTWAELNERDYNFPANVYRDRARATLEAADAVGVSRFTSDGRHTFDELYQYRMAYNALAASALHQLGVDVHKSWNHSDGELCFGGGWFVVHMELPTGQVSNHYKAEFWDIFQIPERLEASEYDGHTPEVALGRLLQSANNPVTDQEIKVGDRVEHFVSSSLDYRTVIAVGEDWLWLDFQRAELDQGHAPTKLPKNQYKKVG